MANVSGRAAVHARARVGEDRGRRAPAWASPHYAQEQLGDVVFVELPKVGAKVTQLKTFGVVESVKAVSDLFAPLSGEVVEVNAELAQAAGEGQPGSLRRRAG